MLVLGRAVGLLALVAVAGVVIYALLPIQDGGLAVDPSPPPEAKPAPVADGWVQLFNGRDLTGWTPSKHSPGDWRIEGGVLVGRNGPGYLVGERFYENFRLRVTGQDQRRREQRRQLPALFQSEIRSDPLCPTGTLLRIRPQTSVLAHYPRPAPVDEWFTLEIRAEGRRTVGPGQRRAVGGGARRPPAAHLAGPLGTGNGTGHGGAVPQDRDLQGGDGPVARGGEGRRPGPARRAVGRDRHQVWTARSRPSRARPPSGGLTPTGTRSSCGAGGERLAGAFEIDAENKALWLRPGGEPVPIRCPYRFDGDRLTLDFPNPRRREGRHTRRPFAPDDRLTSLNNLKEMGIAHARLLRRQ